MASIATSTYLPPLEVAHEREGIGRELELVLHELVNLSLIGKHLHWAVIGPGRGLSTGSWAGWLTPGAGSLTPSPNGRWLWALSQMGRRRLSRPAHS
jgi:hypothetical protein